MGAFSGMKDAKRGFSSNGLRPGKYVVRIDQCDFFESDNGTFWKNTLTVLAVEQGEHKVGEVVHTFFRFENTAEKKQIFQRNLKAFIAGVLDCDDEAIDEAKTVECYSEQSLLKGLVTVVTVGMKTSKTGVYKDGPKKGEPTEYPTYSWSPCLDPEATKAAIGEEVYVAQFPNG